MPARKINNWWHAGFYFKRERYRERCPENSRAGAEAYELHLRQRLARGEDIRKPAVAEKLTTFAEFSKEWFETYVKANNKPSEQRNKEIALRKYLVPSFGGTAVSGITDFQVDRFKRSLSEAGLCNKSINNYLAILAKALRSAKSWKLASEVPVITSLKYILKPVNALSDDECARLLRNTAEPMWHAMIVLALRTGLRLGELFGLRWCDIDTDNHVLVVGQSIVRGFVSTPKSGRARFVPLEKTVEDTLAALNDSREGLVFHRGDGTPLSHRMAARALDRACKRVGIRHIGWHTLRHTVGTQLHKSRVPMRDIQTILGHSSLAMTERYTHVLLDDLRAGIAALGLRQDRLLDESGQQVGSTSAAATAVPNSLAQDCA